jgi:hypothetical protein
MAAWWGWDGFVHILALSADSTAYHLVQFRIAWLPDQLQIR